MNTTVVSSAIISTDAYMSPESFDLKRNFQTDIWSVGVVLYALLADHKMAKYNLERILQSGRVTQNEDLN